MDKQRFAVSRATKSEAALVLRGDDAIPPNDVERNAGAVDARCIEGTGFRVRDLRFARLASYSAHMHAGAHAALVYEGLWTDEAAGIRRRLVAGDMMLHPPDTEHETIAEAGTHVIVIEMSKSFVAGFCHLYGDKPSSALISFDDVEGLADRIAAEVLRRDEAAVWVIHSLALQLLAMGSRTSPAFQSGTPDWISRLVAYIHMNLGQHLTIRQLAATAAISDSHLSHSFTRYLGCTVKDYIRDCRLRAAARALRHTNHSIQQIAAETGFFDAAHFCRAFKASRGVTPTEYRQTRAAG